MAELGMAGPALAEQGMAGPALAEQGMAEQGMAGPALAEQGMAGPALAEPTLADGVAGAVERLVGLFRSLTPPGGLSLTAAATLATLERSGPCRLTWLATREGVTQPAMTQLIARLQDAGLAARATDPADGRVVQVRITAEGKAILARRRAARAGRLAGLLDRLTPEQRDALAAALPAMDALVGAQSS